MAYCTATEARSLTGISIAAMPDADVDALVLDADAEINGALAGFYTVPFVNVPILIKNISKRLTAFYMLVASYSGHSKNKAPNAETWYSNSMMDLEKIKEGKKKLLCPLTNTIIQPINGMTVDEPVIEGTVVDDEDDFVMPDMDEDYDDYYLTTENIDG